jgi:hypothetical protein
MILTQREKLLITYALYIMEGQCAGRDLHYEIEDELGGTPDPTEVRDLMNKVK